MLLFSSCTSNQKRENGEIITKLYIPSFPDPVASDGSYIVEPNEDYTAVTLPYWYWIQICQYALDVENVAQSVNAPASKE